MISAANHATSCVCVMVPKSGGQRVRMCDTTAVAVAAEVAVVCVPVCGCCCVPAIPVPVRVSVARVPVSGKLC